MFSALISDILISVPSPSPEVAVGVSSRSPSVSPLRRQVSTAGAFSRVCGVGRTTLPSSLLGSLSGLMIKST